MVSITKQLLKIKSNDFDIEVIRSVNLQRCDIDDLGCISECVGLEWINLSQNDISRLFPIAGLTNLVHLDLSANRISSLEGLQTLDSLRVLNLAGNLIGSVDSLRCLVTLEQLSDLRLQDRLKNLTNPICMARSYHDQVIAMLSNLADLDGDKLKGVGSDFYKLCNQLDTVIADCSEQRAALDSLSAQTTVEPWTSKDYWTVSKATASESAEEKQLADLLNECRQSLSSLPVSAVE